jgi:hypothetical protein
MQSFSQQLGIVSDEHKKKLRRRYDEMFASTLDRERGFGNFDWRSSELADNEGVFGNYRRRRGLGGHPRSPRVLLNPGKFENRPVGRSLFMLLSSIL